MNFICATFYAQRMRVLSVCALWGRGVFVKVSMSVHVVYVCVCMPLCITYMLTNSLIFFLFGTVLSVALLCKRSLMNSDLSKVKYEAFGRSGCSLEDNWVRLWRDAIN